MCKEFNLLKKTKSEWFKKRKIFLDKYLVFIDIKNAYDKVVHRRMFNKLVEQGISEDIIVSIKLLDSKVKLKILIIIYVLMWIMEYYKEV